jgi:hypothetical protein
MKVLDIDILRPESSFIHIGGKDIDVSFVPCAITWDIDTIIRELYSIGTDEILKNGESTKRAFDLSIKMCSIFCEHKYSELNEDWFRENCDANQIKIFVEAIQVALFKSYNTGIENNSKNLKAPKKKI